MRKLLLTIVAFGTALAAAAQTNLALNKQAYASSVSDENATFVAANAVDGNTGSKWASNYDTKGALGNTYDKDAQWIYVDLGAEVDVNTVKIFWDNQPAKTFDIRYSTEAPESDDAVKTTGTVALADQTASTETYVFPNKESVKARYIIIDLKERNTGWGYGITELEVYNIDYTATELKSIKVSPVFFLAGEATNFTTTATDNFNNPMATGVTYTLNDEAFTGSYTATSSGTWTIIGTDAKGNKAEADIIALDDNDADAPTTTIPEDATLIYGKGTPTNDWHYAELWNGGAVLDTELTINDVPVRSFTDLNCVFIANSDLNDWNIAVNPTAMAYGTLHFSVYAPADETAVKVVFEETTKIGNEHPFTLNQGWNDIEVDLKGETNFKTISLRGEGLTLAVANVYYTKAAASDDAGKISAISALPAIVALNVATDIELTATDVDGVNIDNANVEYTGDGYDNGSVTATKAGKLTITGTTNSGAESATVELYVVDAPDRATNDENTKVIYSDKSTGYDANSTGWEGGFTHLDNLTFSDGTEAFHATNVKTFYIVNPGLSAADLDGYITFHLDIFSNNDKDGVVVNLESINKSATASVKAGEWTGIDVDITGNTAATSWIKVTFPDNDAEILVDNLYFSKEAAEVPFSLVDKDGVAKASGPVDATAAAQINAADAMFIDLTGITEVADGVTIEPTNPNALISVPGTVTDGVAALNPAFSALAGTKNLVVVRGDGYIFPVAQLQLTDENGVAFWNGEGTNPKFVSTGATGWAITRSIPADTYVTAYVPVAVTNANLPAGLSVYELTAATADEVTFNKKAAQEVPANFPVILHNTTGAAIDFVVSGQNDFGLVNLTVQNSQAFGGVTFQGNVEEITTDGTQYILQGQTESDLTFKKADGAKISPFRAYVTGLSSSAKAIFVDAATGIRTIAVSAIDGAESVYNVAGQKVSGQLQKGLYIVNGKKVIIK